MAAAWELGLISIIFVMFSCHVALSYNFLNHDSFAPEVCNVISSPAPSPTDPASTPTSVASPSGSRKLSSAIRDSFLDPAFWTPLVPLIPPQVPACAGTLTLLPDPSSFLKMLRLLISPAPPSTWSQDPLSPVERPVLLVRS